MKAFLIATILLMNTSCICIVPGVNQAFGFCVPQGYYLYHDKEKDNNNRSEDKLEQEKLETPEEGVSPNVPY